MASRQKKNRKLGRGGKAALKVLGALMLLAALTCGVGVINAGVVRVRRATVEIPDLPPAFDGRTILYASDIDLCGLNTPEKSAALLDRLQSLKPDMLILGGDYNAPTLTELLNRRTDGAAALQKRTDFFRYISAFDAPLGKYAIAAPEDADPDGLRSLMSETGIRPLFNDRAAIRVGADTLWIVGVSADTVSLNAAGNAFSRNDCVIVVAYSPTVLPVLVTSEAGDGGPWADFALTGHTHGGQVRLFGRTALQLDRQEQHFLSGWTMENALPILTTAGVGCEGLNLRLGTEPEVWMITLERDLDAD